MLVHTTGRALRALALIGTAAIAVPLAGCASPGAAENTAGETTIVWDMWSGSESDLVVLQAQAKIAEEQNPGVKVELRTAPWNDYYTKLTTNLASGAVACITGMSGVYTSGYSDALMPLSDEDLAAAGVDPADLAEGALDILSHDGKVYGIPFDIAAMQVYYNADAFTAAGAAAPTIGWSFDDFEAAARAVSSQKPAFAAAMGDFQWMSLPIAMAKKQAVNESGELDISDPEFVKAASWYAQFAVDGIASAPPSASSSGWGEEEFRAGNVAMAVDGTWNAVTYLNNDAGFEAGVVDLPQGADGRLGLVLGSGYGIGAGCKDKETALKVLGSLVSPEAQDYIASSGRSYPVRTASQPLYFDSIDKAYREKVRAAFEASFQQVEGARSTADWSKVYAGLQPNLVTVYTGQNTMADVLAQTQDQFGR